MSSESNVYLDAFYGATDHGNRYEFDYKAIQLEEPRPPLSPRMLIQEMMPTKFWVMISSIMMVRTQRRAGHQAVWNLLDRFDNPVSFAIADKREIKRCIEEAGLANRRAKQLMAVSKQWMMGIRPWPIKDFMGEPTSPDGVGPYITNSYRLFALGDTGLAVQDDELRQFMVWAHGRRRRGLQWRHEYPDD